MPGAATVLMPLGVDDAVAEGGAMLVPLGVDDAFAAGGVGWRRVRMCSHRCKRLDVASSCDRTAVLLSYFGRCSKFNKICWSQVGHVFIIVVAV